MMAGMEKNSNGNGRGESDGGSGLGLGLVPPKLARTDNFPFRVAPQPFPSGNPNGPTFYNGTLDGGSSDLYLYDVAGSAAAVTRTLQPFPNTASAFKSPGVGMAASLRYPFTSAQWQELERQALIYKYIMASVPVPPDLLMPLTRSLSETAAASHSNFGRSCFNLRFSNCADPEPGRCRRTDGKKWRCSRDVAPDQKYCERHMHRGRPRSRKPVEVQAQNTSSLPVSTPAASAINTASNGTLSRNMTTTTKPSQPSGIFSKPDVKLPYPTMISAAADRESRYLDWMKGGADQLGANQQWPLMHSKLGLRTGSNNGYSPVLQDYEEHLNLNFSDFGSGCSEPQQNDQCSLFLNSDFTSLEDANSDQRHSQPPRRFIDAWSIASTANPTSTNETSKTSCVSSGAKRCLSSLTLSMPNSTGTAEEMDQIHMGLGISESESENGAAKSQPLSWMNPVPWLTSPLGGPLGEVLQSSTTTGSNSASPHGSSKSSCGALNLMIDGCGEGPSPRDSPPHVASSPSGVLQKTLASLSDSSGGNSPTFGAAKSETTLQWLSNQSKLPS